MFDHYLNKIPEWIKIGAIIVSLFVVPTVLIYLTAYYEGFASILFLIAGIAFYKTSQKNLLFEHYGFIIGFIFFFAILGMVFDGAGNFVYNKPIENLCPAENELVRDVKFVENYDGEDSILHQFSCFSMPENKIIYQIPRWKTLGIRFLEYILIGMIFVGFYWIIPKFMKTKKG